jgi:AmmeMemoRadiSam system protein B
MPSSNGTDRLPRLRRLDIVPIQRGGETLFGLRDPSGLAESMMAVSAGALLIVQMLDGEHTMRQLQTALAQRTGQFVPSTQIEQMIRQLDEHLLLETARFQEFREQRAQEYRAAGVRVCTHAEGGYPSDRDGFVEMVETWLTALPPRESPVAGEIVGAIAPHIDFERGSASYAHVYRDLADACEADLFVILGTDHFGDTQFAATWNDFETPLGRVHTAKDVLEQIESKFIGDLFDGELQHVGEHTIELQVVLLQRFFGEEREFEIVPLLCGGLDEEFESGSEAMENAEVLSIVECLQELMDEGDRKACLIASADLSHVGPRFGAPRPLTASDLGKVEKHDRQVLEAAMVGDADGMFRLVSERHNDTNICGLAPIYVLLKTLREFRGELLDYRQATSPDGQQSVSFAAATLWR